MQTTLLYYTETSLTNVMPLTKHFGSLSGFSINWSKSVLLQLEELRCPLEESASSLQIVTQFKYLGIQVTSDPL